jgi:hypothetical protein
MNRKSGFSSPVQVKKSGRRLSLSAIQRAEEELGVTFPTEYREFLLAHNGGVPEPNGFEYKRRGRMEQSWVQMFCPITGSREDPLNLRGQNEMVVRWASEGTPVPNGCIAVGYDGPGNSILISTMGRDTGRVWLKVWDDTLGVTGIPDDADAGLYPLARSFFAFLRNLRGE